MSESGGLSPGKRWYMQVGNYPSVLLVLMFAVLTLSASHAPIAVAASASGQGQPAAVAADTLIPPDRPLFLGRARPPGLTTCSHRMS